MPQLVRANCSERKWEQLLQFVEKFPELQGPLAEKRTWEETLWQASRSRSGTAQGPATSLSAPLLAASKEEKPLYSYGTNLKPPTKVYNVVLSQEKPCFQVSQEQVHLYLQKQSVFSVSILLAATRIWLGFSFQRKVHVILSRVARREADAYCCAVRSRSRPPIISASKYVIWDD